MSDPLDLAKMAESILLAPFARPVARTPCPVCGGRSAESLIDYCRNCGGMGYIVTEADHAE
jgi:DnaJ-class molecular chaperone